LEKLGQVKKHGGWVVAKTGKRKATTEGEGGGKGKKKGTWKNATYAVAGVRQPREKHGQGGGPSLLGQENNPKNQPKKKTKGAATTARHIVRGGWVNSGRGSLDTTSKTNSHGGAPANVGLGTSTGGGDTDFRKT